MTERADFERLALPHLDAAYNLAFWLLRSRADAEDAVQDAYLRAYRSFGNLRGDDIRPWLLKIVRNVALRKLSDKARTANVIPFDAAVSDRLGTEHAAMQVAADTPSAEEIMVGASERAMVRAALGELAPSFREVIVLREMEALSYKEIATMTGVPLGTVMSRLARARAELRTILARMMKDGESDAM
jgi:RNA polymerase sigma-70 factor, ECF subfamily